MNNEYKKLNSYKYEQYNSVWAKSISLEELKEDFGVYNDDQELILKAIEGICMYYTSESCCDNFQLEKDAWKTTQQQKEFVSTIMKACDHYRELEVKEILEERDDCMAYYSDLEQKKFLENWYKTAPIDKDHQLKDPTFVQHEELQQKFLTEVFGDEVRFYSNKTVEEAHTCLFEEGRVIPAIIGIDDNIVSMLWFHYS